PHINTAFSFSTISPSELVKCSRSMKASRSGYLTSCPSLLYKCAIPIVAEPLTCLLNLSIQTSTFPKCLKRAVITPIYKAGKRSDPSNYRPISVTSFQSKLFERLYKKQITDYLESNGLLSKS